MSAYLKVTNPEENHNGLQYKDGLIIDPIPFNSDPKKSCCEGGIYFTTSEYICKFLDYGIWVREVTIPKDVQMIKDPHGDKWRADQVVLRPRKSLAEVSTWEWLISLGVDFHVYDEAPLRNASYNGHFEVVKYLIEKGADFHVYYEAPLRNASYNDHFEIVKYLKSLK